MRLEFESNVSTPSFTENAAADMVSENGSSQAKTLLHNGIKAAQSGNRAEARHLLLRVTEIEPHSENAWLWLASISEYPEELLIFLNNVLDVNPNNQRALEWMKATKSLLAKTFVQRGIDATRENQKNFAKQCFFQAVAHDDQNEMAWLWLASVSEFAEDKKSYLDKVLNINPANEAAQTALRSAHFEMAQVLVKKANALAAAGKTEAADELLAEIFQKAPELEEAWLLKSYLAASFDEKFKYYEKVLEINAHNETAQFALNAFQTILNIAAPKFETETFEEAAETQIVVEETASPEPETMSFVEETRFAEETTGETFAPAVQEEIQFAGDFVQDNSPTQELELPQAFIDANPFEEAEIVEEAEEIHEKVDAFFESLAENRKVEENDFSENLFEETVESNQFTEETEVAPAAEFDAPETVAQFEETTFAETQEESFTPQQHSFDASDLTEESVQFAEEAHENSFEAVEPNAESVVFEASEPQYSQAFKNKSEDLYYQELAYATPAESEEAAEETAPTENFDATENVPSEPAFETESQLDNYSYQKFTESLETVESEEVAETAHAEETASVSSEESFAAEEPSNIEYVQNEEAAETFAEPEPVENSATEHFFAEEPSVQVEEARAAETQEVFAQAEETAVHAEETLETQAETFAAKPHSETATCPFCNTENEIQAVTCNSCRAVLSLSNLETLLSNQAANQVLLHQAVSRMELEKNLRPFDADELLFLGIGYINLQNLRQGFAYLQEAAQMRPDDFLLNSQVNALTIRISDIKKQEEIQDLKPKGRTILVVDDSATVRKLICGKLEKSGHEVVCAIDGMDALAKLNEIVPDLILLDITMPRMDGYQVCKLIRNNQATKDIPVVMISGKDGFFDKVRGRMAGTTGYITKPFGPETLMKALDAYIKNGNHEAN